MTAVVLGFTGTYRFLSNFYPAEFYAPGIGTGGYDVCYPTVEHFYQAAKTLTQADWLRVMDCGKPGDAKRAGRLVEIRPDWEHQKKRVMLTGVMAKFVQNPQLGDLLDCTNDDRLVEANTWGDTYWGECPPGSGENWLGRILMMVRDVLR